MATNFQTNPGIFLCGNHLFGASYYIICAIYTFGCMNDVKSMHVLSYVKPIALLACRVPLMSIIMPSLW